MSEVSCTGPMGSEKLDLELYTMTQLAEMWGMTESYIKRMIKAGELQAISLGSNAKPAIRVTADAAGQFIKSRRAAPSQPPVVQRERARKHVFM